jgi:hypothetical protein
MGFGGVLQKLNLPIHGFNFLLLLENYFGFLGVKFGGLREVHLNLHIGRLGWCSEAHRTRMILIGIEVGALFTQPVHFEFLRDYFGSLFFLLLHVLLLQLQDHFKSRIDACILAGH